MEGDCSVNYGLDGGNVAGATLIGSIAETNTCRITRLARLLHIHTSGGSTVDKEEENEEEEDAEKEKEKEEKKEEGRKRKNDSGERKREVGREKGRTRSGQVCPFINQRLSLWPRPL